jgi:hypothetical protein
MTTAVDTVSLNNLSCNTQSSVTCQYQSYLFPRSLYRGFVEQSTKESRLNYGVSTNDLQALLLWCYIVFQTGQDMVAIMRYLDIMYQLSDRYEVREM